MCTINGSVRASQRTFGCDKIFEDKASGAQRECPELRAALEFVRKGDTLVVWKLDRLARSLKHLIETVELLSGQTVVVITHDDQYYHVADRCIRLEDGRIGKDRRLRPRVEEERAARVQI